MTQTSGQSRLYVCVEEQRQEKIRSFDFAPNLDGQARAFPAVPRSVSHWHHSTPAPCFWRHCFALITMSSSDEENQQQHGCCLTVNNAGCRKKWMPLIKTLFASAADVASDWFFFYRTRENEDPDIVELHDYLFAFCCVSSVMFVLVLLSFLSKSQYFSWVKCFLAPLECIRLPINAIFCCSCFGVKSWTPLQLVLFLEDFFEDIPQLVLTGMVTVRLGGFTSAAVLNLTTSSFNLVMNIIDKLTPDDTECSSNTSKKQEL